MISNRDDYNKWQDSKVDPIVNQLNEITSVFDALIREEDMPLKRIMLLVNEAWKQYDKVTNDEGYAMWHNHSRVADARLNLYNTQYKLFVSRLYSQF